MKTIITLSLLTILNFATFAMPHNDGVDPTKKSFKKWMNEFVAYPAETILQAEEGLVLISFEISEYGNAENLQVESGISEALNQKALEMVKEMPTAHLYENGFTEGTRFIVPIQFTLN